MKVGDFEIKAMSKTQLANCYSIGTATLLKWVKGMPKDILKKLQYPNKNAILTPKQVELIVSHLGEP